MGDWPPSLPSTTRICLEKGTRQFTNIDLTIHISGIDFSFEMNKGRNIVPIVSTPLEMFVVVLCQHLGTSAAWLAAVYIECPCSSVIAPRIVSLKGPCNTSGTCFHSFLRARKHCKNYSYCQHRAALSGLLIAADMSSIFWSGYRVHPLLPIKGSWPIAAVRLEWKREKNLLSWFQNYRMGIE